MQFVVDNPGYSLGHRATNFDRDELAEDDLDLMDNEHPSPDMPGYTRLVIDEHPRIAVVIASGPSLTDQDAADAAGADCVITVNTSWQKAPWADHLFVNDERWWRYRDPETNERYFERVQREFSGETWCGQIKAMERGDCERHLAIEFARPGFRPVGHHLICGGNNSGHTAINMAAKFGFANIILLGFDMTGSHWHPDHPGGPPSHENPKANWILNMNELAVEAHAQGYHIINASRETALTCFERLPIKEAMLWMRRNGSPRWMPAIEWAQTREEELQATAHRKRMGWENV